MYFIIAAWGNPKNWEFAEYEWRSKSIRTRSSTSALFSGLEDNAQVLIICGLSLMTELSGLPEEVAGKTYKSISSDISSNIKGWVTWGRDNMEKDDLSERMFDSARIAVAPNKGTFAKDGAALLTLDIATDIFGSYVFFQIVKFLEENDNPSQGDVDVYLDLTHGINYMSTITYDMSILASAFYSSLTGKKVHVEVLNSDPFQHAVKGQESAPKLNINHIGSLDFDRKLGIDHIIFTINTNLQKFKASEKNLGDDELLKLIIALKYSTENGFITLLDAMTDKIETLYQQLKNDMVEKLDNTIGGWVLALENNRLSISPQVKLTTGIEWLAAYSLVRFISEVIRPSDGWRTFSEVRSITDGYIRNAATKAIIRSEISNISGKLSEKYRELDFPIKASEVLGKKEGDIEVRNLTAHGGLERNITMLRVKNTAEIPTTCSNTQLNKFFKEKTEAKCNVNLNEILEKINGAEGS